MQKLHRANYRTACAPYCATVKHHDSKSVCKKHTYAQEKRWENTDQKGTVFLGVMIFLSVFPDSFFFNLFILVGGGLLDNIVVVFCYTLIQISHGFTCVLILFYTFTNNHQQAS